MEKKEKKKISVPAAYQMRALVSREIMTILERHKKIRLGTMKLALLQKYGATDKMLYDFLDLFQNEGIIKYDEENVELVTNDILRETNKLEPEGDRTQPGDEHNGNAEKQVREPHTLREGSCDKID